MKRHQEEAILHDLKKKMVLLMGPRQAGKTWLAKTIASHFSRPMVLNYDQSLDRDIIRRQAWLPDTELLVLDELHKMPEWKNYLKGLFDTRPPGLQILITGSARLDAYNHMGDSLVGRYFRHNLFPLSLSELSTVGEPCDLSRLLSRGGFPEPYLAETALDAERWRVQYINGILSTDVFEFEKIHNLKAMQLVFTLLRERVGSPISYQSIAEDVGISSATVKHYIQILEALFVIFKVTPYSKNIARSLLKEPKIYFFDIGLVNGDAGAKFENFAAISFYKYVQAKIDYQAKEYALHYLRTKEGHEVDFVLVCNEQVESIIEVKVNNRDISKSLKYFHEKYGYSAIQVVQTVTQGYHVNKILVLDPISYFSTLK